MQRGLVAWLGAALVVVAGACSERPAPPDGGGSAQPSANAPYDGTWKLIDGRGPGGKIPIVDGYRITMTIEEKAINGTAACNEYGGNVAIDGRSFDVLDGSSTETGCRRDVMDSETAYMEALLLADDVSRDGDTLTLTGKDVLLRFEIVPPVPTAELIDTRWELESLVHGRGNGAVVSSAVPAWLVLDRDGTIRGTTGCRDLNGEWTEDGDEIDFPIFGAKGNCPEGLRDQDGHVVTVLGDGFAPTIEGDRLTLIDRGGLGLEYRAAG